MTLNIAKTIMAYFGAGFSWWEAWGPAEFGPD